MIDCIAYSTHPSYPYIAFKSDDKYMTICNIDNLERRSTLKTK